jgi:hypothetical protein
MAGYKPWFERLKDPRWQKKRLEVMQRAGFACEWCESKDMTLHVHHTYYEKYREPWDYPDWALMCLCESCHEQASEMMHDLSIEIGRLRYFLPLAALFDALRSANESGDWAQLSCPEAKLVMHTRTDD